VEFLDPAFWSMVLSTFIAATIIPFSSELGLSALLYAGYPVVLIVTGAIIGNTLGGMTGYLLGSLGKWSWLEKYLGVKEEKVKSLAKRYEKYGVYLAFFCWLPIVGDVFGVMLGFFRTPWLPTLLLMALGKTLRYIALAMIVLELI